MVRESVGIDRLFAALLVSLPVIRHLRNPASRARNAMLLLACAALMLHAIVPTGFMLDLDTATGDLSFVICPSQASAPGLDDPAAGHGGHGGHGGNSQADAPHPSYDMPGEVCDFSATTLPPISIATTTVATWSGIAAEPVAEYRHAAPSSVSLSAASSRGPPSIS